MEVIYGYCPDGMPPYLEVEVLEKLGDGGILFKPIEGDRDGREILELLFTQDEN
jgi:hypothetical protein